MIYYTIIHNIGFVAALSAAAWCAWKISTTDLKRRIIPDAYLFPLMLIGLVITVFFPWICTPKMSVLGGVFGYGLGALVGYIFDRAAQKNNPKSPAPIGMGDIKLLGVGGIWLGPTGLSIALILACISGAIWSYVRHQRYIPFAPFFICGGILALLSMSFLL